VAVEVTEIHEARVVAGYWRAVAGIVGVLLAAGWWNAQTLSPDLGYDADQHQQYAHLLIDEGRIPEMNIETRALYDNPPGFYAIAGAAGKIGGDGAILYLNVVFAAGAALLVLALARELWPGRALLQLGTLVFAAWLPLVAKSAGMYHPAALALLVAAAGIYLAGRMLARRDYGLRLAVLLGVLLLAGIGVQSSSVWVYVAVLAAFGAALVTGEGPRAGPRNAILAILAVTAMVAVPWVARQAVNDVPVLGNLPPLTAPWDARPVAFFTDLGLPDSVTRPYRPLFANLMIPTVYSDLWGDYFGNFAWNSSVDDSPPGGLAAEVTAQNWIGLLPTGFALAGLAVLAVLATRRPGNGPALVLLVGLALLALAGFLYYAGNAITPDGDTIKAIFVLTATPAWAAGFGFAVDRLAQGRARVPILVALGVLALANVRFLVAGSPLGGLL
jgi:hypothetical protein